MRIHTSLTQVEMHCAAIAAGTDVYPDFTRHGSRTHAHAFEVSLTGYGARHTRRKQHGNHGHAATWSDWGRFLAALYARDTAAKCWAYADAEDFHAKTAFVFDNMGMVDDEPKRLAAEVRAKVADRYPKREAIQLVAHANGLPAHIVRAAIFGE